MSRTDRYAVFTSELSDAQRDIVGDNYEHFKVWDRELGRWAPFGGYGNVDGAQRRAYRMNHPTGWDTGDQRLCLKCADAHMPTAVTEGGNRTGWLPVQGTLEQACAWCGISLRRTDRRVKSCGALYDHGPHTHDGPGDVLRCAGNGPSRDRETAKLEPETYPGPPCVCTDSIRSTLGYCPTKGDREYDHCPVRSGRLKENGRAT